MHRACSAKKVPRADSYRKKYWAIFLLVAMSPIAVNAVCGTSGGGSQEALTGAKPWCHDCGFAPCVDIYGNCWSCRDVNGNCYKYHCKSYLASEGGWCSATGGYSSTYGYCTTPPIPKNIPVHRRRRTSSPPSPSPQPVPVPSPTPTAADCKQMTYDGYSLGNSVDGQSATACCYNSGSLIPYRQCHSPSGEAVDCSPCAMKKSDGLHQICLYKVIKPGLQMNKRWLCGNEGTCDTDLQKNNGGTTITIGVCSSGFSSTASSSHSQSSSSAPILAIVLGVVGGVIFLCVCVAICAYCWFKHKGNAHESSLESKDAVVAKPSAGKV